MLCRRLLLVDVLPPRLHFYSWLPSVDGSLLGRSSRIGSSGRVSLSAFLSFMFVVLVLATFSVVVFSCFVLAVLSAPLLLNEMTREVVFEKKKKNKSAEVWHVIVYI
jgi:hypothetical protein